MPLFSPEQTAVGALLLMRVTALMWTAPMFSSRPVPTQLKTVVTVLLTILLFPVAAAAPAAGVGVNPASIVTELTVGLVLGIGAGMFVAAAESTGDMVAVQMGLSGANVLNPISSTQMPILGQFLGLFVLTVILTVGGEQIILGALSDSLTLAPVGFGGTGDGTARLAQGVRAFVGLGGSIFLMGLRFAAPVVAAMMVGNAALGIMARTVPQLNVLMVAFPLQIAIGLFTLAASLEVLGTYFQGFEVRYVEAVAPILETMAPAPGGI